MKFTEHRDSQINTVKRYQAGQVQVNQQVISTSCFITHDSIETDWPCKAINALNNALLDQLLALQPEVIILGTGETQEFPEPKWFAYCASKGVGLEVMTNNAACRTYNVLTTEERDIVLALIF